MKATGRLTGNAVVATVMSNIGLEHRAAREPASSWSAARSATST